MRIVLELSGAAIYRTMTLFVLEEDRGEATAKLLRDFINVIICPEPVGHSIRKRSP